MSDKSEKGISWKVLAVAVCSACWLITTGIVGWNLHETISLGKEVARIETKIDMSPLVKSNADHQILSYIAHDDTKKELNP